MNRLKILLVPLVMVLSACENRYGSKFEAEQSCESWISQGGTWIDGGIAVENVRRCVEDAATSQFLGLDDPSMNNRDLRDTYDPQRIKWISDELPVAKRFKW